MDQLDDLMMAEETRKTGRNGVKFINSHYFADELYGINDKVLIKYSLFDLSYVKVYRLDGSYVCKANAVLAVHPMAEYLGEAKDVESFKQALKTTKRAQKQTIKNAKALLKTRNNKVLDWQVDAIEVESRPAIEDKKSKTRKGAEKDYGNIEVDVSNINIASNKNESADFIPLFDWQIEEMKRKRLQM
jgi:hypothetical protein